MDAFGLLSLFWSDGESVAHVDAFDQQHPVLGLDLAQCLDFVPLRIDFDLTRFQRAGEGAGQSPARRGDDVVQRRRVRFEDVGRHLVVLRHRPVHPEEDRFLLDGQPG